MTQQPGWHPDPTQSSEGAQAGRPAQLRYWDGTRWTEHTSPAQDPAASPYYGTPQTPYADGRTTTPDGVRLAGWWHRVGAYLIDALILGVVAAILAYPWIRDIVDTYVDWFDEAMNSGSATPDTAQLQRDIAGPLAITVAIQLAVGLVYQVGFLMWKQATPGKLALGLRVRLRERPGPMPIGTVLVRWVAQFGVGLLNLIPVVGALGGLYSLLDHLWPLWDGNRQAIHDKAAKTNVMRVR